MPEERTYHQSISLKNHMIVFGGQGKSDLNDLFILDLDTLKWQLPFLSTSKPPPRRFHSATKWKSSMVVFGGCCDEFEPLNDLWIIDFEG